MIACSAAGLLLADVLTAFSYDILRIILQYLPRFIKPASLPTFVFKFGGVGTDHGEFQQGCYSMTINPHDGNLWSSYSISVLSVLSFYLRVGRVGDRYSCQIFTPQGQYLYRVAYRFVDWCTGIAFDNGEVFISDYDGQRIVVCGTDGKFIRTIGDGQFNYPHTIVADGKGQLFVADTGNSRIRVLRRDGSVVREFGKRGLNDGDFISPRGMALHNQELFIADEYSGVQVSMCVVYVLFALFRCLTRPPANSYADYPTTNLNQEGFRRFPWCLTLAMYSSAKTTSILCKFTRQMAHSSRNLAKT